MLPRKEGNRNAFAEEAVFMVQTSSIPCTGYNVAVLFPDVEPEVLAVEAASEARLVGGLPAADAWQTYLRRVLPSPEGRSSREMAKSLLRAGAGQFAALAHANLMRRNAIAGGDVRRARFWADVASCIARDEVM